MTRQIIQEMVDWEVQMQLNKKIKICFLCFVVLLASACAKNKIMQFRSYGIDYLENADYESALEYFNEAMAKLEKCNMIYFYTRQNVSLCLRGIQRLVKYTLYY